MLFVTQYPSFPRTEISSINERNRIYCSLVTCFLASTTFFLNADGTTSGYFKIYADGYFNGGGYANDDKFEMNVLLEQEISMCSVGRIGRFYE